MRGFVIANVFLLCVSLGNDVTVDDLPIPTEATLVQKVPYNDSAIFAHQVSALCPVAKNSDYLAIGLTFVGGVESLTVGPASLPIPCHHMLAQPELPVRRPSFTRRPHRPGVDR